MQSRMEKYNTNEKSNYERIKKNTKLYDEVNDDIYRQTAYQNMEVIDSAKEINLSKLKGMLDDKYETRQYRKSRNYSLEDTNDFEEPVPNIYERKKTYDINEIINEAKNKRTFLEEAKEKQKYMDYSSKKIKQDDEYEMLKKEEEELEDLINSVASHSNESSDELDLFTDLKGDDNTVVIKPIETTFEVTQSSGEITDDLEKTLVKADKTFYTDSNMFTKNDFEDFNTLTITLMKKKTRNRFFVALILFIILIVSIYILCTQFIFR